MQCECLALRLQLREHIARQRIEQAVALPHPVSPRLAKKPFDTARILLHLMRLSIAIADPDPTRTLRTLARTLGGSNQKMETPLGLPNLSGVEEVALVGASQE